MAKMTRKGGKREAASGNPVQTSRRENAESDVKKKPEGTESPSRVAATFCARKLINDLRDTGGLWFYLVLEPGMNYRSMGVTVSQVNRWAPLNPGKPLSGCEFTHCLAPREGWL